jgi:hypothetical protein
MVGALAVLGLPEPDRAAGQAVEVGVARVDITPEYPVRLAGYAVRTRESVGVQQRIWAKALALGGDEQGPALLLAVDNMGVPEAIAADVAARLGKAGVSPDRVVVASSHTHSAPMLVSRAIDIFFGGTLPAEEKGRVERYTRELADKLQRVAEAALKDRRPARLSWGRGRVGFAENRRTRGGPVDHDLPMLRVADAEGKVRAVVVGYACHCTTLDPADNLISGDWAGDAQEAIEAAFPGSIALTVIGCGGDANPAGRTSLDAARRHGRSIADEVARVFEHGDLAPLAGPPEVRARRVALPFDTLPSREELQRRAKSGGAVGANAAVHLARLDHGEPLPTELGYTIRTWQFGDALAMVFLPGEVVVDYALRLRREFDGRRLWVVAYAGDVPCYIPSERVLREGGYEGGGAMVYYGFPARLKPGVEDRILSAVHALLPARFAAKPER